MQATEGGLALAIKSLQDGKESIQTQVHDQLQTNLLKGLDADLTEAQGDFEDVNDSMSSVSGLPSYIKPPVGIGDLSSVLSFLRDGPMATIGNHLQATHELYDPIVKNTDPTTAQGKALYDHFDNAIAKLASVQQQAAALIPELQKYGL